MYPIGTLLLKDKDGDEENYITQETAIYMLVQKLKLLLKFT